MLYLNHLINCVASCADPENFLKGGGGGGGGTNVLNLTKTVMVAICMQALQSPIRAVGSAAIPFIFSTRS